MKLNRKYFIFETFRNKLCVADQALYSSLSVLKEIKMPCRVKMCVGLVAYTVRMFYILQGIFVFKAKYTSYSRRLVQVILLTNKIWLCYKLLTTTETNTINDTTA